MFPLQNSLGTKSNRQFTNFIRNQQSEGEMSLPVTKNEQMHSGNLVLLSNESPEKDGLSKNMRPKTAANPIGIKSNKLSSGLNDPISEK